MTQATVLDEIEIEGTPTHLIIQIERKLLQHHGIVLKEYGKPIATLTPVVASDHESDEYTNGVAGRPDEAKRFPEFEQEIRAFERMKPELLKQYLGQAVAIYQGKVVATGKNRKDARRNAEKQMGPIHCYVEWVEPVTPRQVIAPTNLAQR